MMLEYRNISFKKWIILTNRSTGTGCPGRLWSLLLWRYSRPAWTRSSTTYCRWPCFGRRFGLDDPQRSLPTPTILWFCEILTWHAVQVHLSPGLAELRRLTCLWFSIQSVSTSDVSQNDNMFTPGSFSLCLLALGFAHISLSLLRYFPFRS